MPSNVVLIGILTLRDASAKVGPIIPTVSSTQKEELRTELKRKGFVLLEKKGVFSVCDIRQLEQLELL